MRHDLPVRRRRRAAARRSGPPSVFVAARAGRSGAACDFERCLAPYFLRMGPPVYRARNLPRARDDGRRRKPGRCVRSRRRAPRLNRGQIRATRTSSMARRQPRRGRLRRRSAASAPRRRSGRFGFASGRGGPRSLRRPSLSGALGGLIVAALAVGGGYYALRPEGRSCRGGREPPCAIEAQAQRRCGDFGLDKRIAALEGPAPQRRSPRSTSASTRWKAASADEPP